MRRAAGLALVALLVGACGGGGGDAEPTGAVSTLPPAAVSFGEAPCPPPMPPPERPQAFAGAPQRCTRDGVDYRATVTTSEGTFTIDLLEGEAPITVNNFVVLARWGWFDGDDFHRIVTGYVIQAGEREQPPGYTIPDELPDDLDAYVPGAVAMANRGPGTGSSQWFVCVDCRGLPAPDYALFGRVTDGLDVVRSINALAVGDGPPSRPVTITAVTIDEVAA